MLENDLLTWLATVLDCDVHYQHINRMPLAPFAWFIRSGDDSVDSLDGDGEPDIVYFDLELYAESAVDNQALAATIRAQRDYRGPLGDSYVDDIAIADQVDGYEQRASSDSLPPFSTTFRLTVSGYGN